MLHEPFLIILTIDENSKFLNSHNRNWIIDFFDGRPSLQKL